MGHNPGCFATGWPRPADVIAAGQGFQLAVLKTNVPQLCEADVLRFITRRDGIVITVGYRSLYGEDLEAMASSTIQSDVLPKLLLLVVGLCPFHSRILWIAEKPLL
jgi:hypothetical protein